MSAIEVSGRTEDVEHQFAGSRCGIDPLFQANQMNATPFQDFDDFEQLQGSAKVIESRDAKPVAGPDMIDQLSQDRALKAMSGNHVGEHKNGAGFDQAILLASSILVGCRNPGIVEGVAFPRQSLCLFNVHLK